MGLDSMNHPQMADHKNLELSCSLGPIFWMPLQFYHGRKHKKNKLQNVDESIYYKLLQIITHYYYKDINYYKLFIVITYYT